MVLERCSSVIRVLRILIRAVAICVATALFLMPSVEASPLVEVGGVPEWVGTAVERSLSAILNSIPEEETLQKKERLLSVVGSRLFQGYTIRAIQVETASVRIELEPKNAPLWEIRVQSPMLMSPAKEWFAADIHGLEKRLGAHLNGVPLEALSWLDQDLRELVDHIYLEPLVGWHTALLVQVVEGEPQLQLSFSPAYPVTLGVNPKVSSRNLPALLYANVREDLLQAYSPIIGLPVAWLEKHDADLSRWSQELLQKYDVVQQAKVEPKVKVEPAPLSLVEVDLESRRFWIDVWLAAYLGNSERYPEVGIHLGRKAQLFPKHEFEVYAEAIATVDRWNLETRLGLRLLPWGDVQVGAEWSNREHAWWLRLAAGSRVKEPYGWLRLSEDGDFNAATGWRFTDNFSVEIFYDSRDESFWSIRAISNL